MKDRDQKRAAIQFSVANRWFPQLEIGVLPKNPLSEKTVLATDLDVYSSIPDALRGYRTLVFDCKTRARESAINRCFWLQGVMTRMAADQGFSILRKDKRELDHRLMANGLGIILLDEKEFEVYAEATTPGYKKVCSKITDLDTWEYLFSIATKYPNLSPALTFLRSTYWMLDDSAQACRKTLAELRKLHPELDPAKPEHKAVFLEFCALFARSLALMCCTIFKAYFKPARQEDLSEALLILLYGGREAYDYRNELYRRLAAGTGRTPGTELTLPEWDRFVQLFRQLLDAPLESQRVPLMFRETTFCTLTSDSELSFVRTLFAESPQGAKFLFLIASYLCKATQLPPDFAKQVDSSLLPLIPIK